MIRLHIVPASGVTRQPGAAIASVIAMELLVGAERAGDARKQARSVHVEAVLASLPIEDHTLAVARNHAHLHG